jgi:hypothetical protein
MRAAALAAVAAVATVAGPAAAEKGAPAAADPDAIVPDRGARRTAAEANLEPRRHREGLMIGFALGGSIQVGFTDAVEEASGTGTSFDLRIGTTATERLLFFLDLFAAGQPRQDDTSMTRVNPNTVLAVGVQYFLVDALWVRTAIGWGHFEAKSEVPEVVRDGLGSITGGGMDFLRRGRFALSGELTFVSSLYRDGFISALNFQLGFTWY